MMMMMMMMMVVVVGVVYDDHDHDDILTQAGGSFLMCYECTIAYQDTNLQAKNDKCFTGKVLQQEVCKNGCVVLDAKATTDVYG